MTREVVTRTDGETIDIVEAQAESYDNNAKVLVSAGVADIYIQKIAYKSGTSLPEYIGLALPGTADSAATWQIKKLTYSGNSVISILFAHGDTKFNNVWDDRADTGEITYS